MVLRGERREGIRRRFPVSSLGGFRRHWKPDVEASSHDGAARRTRLECRAVRDRKATESCLSTRTGDIRFCLSGYGSPILLVAGVGGGKAVFARQIEHLASRHRVVTWDLRGLSRDDLGPCLSLAEHARDALRILESLGA